MRNVLAHVAKGEAEMVAAVFRTIFAQPDLASMAKQWDKVRNELAGRYPKFGALMDAAKAQVLAFAAFPREHWRKI
jgi:putative transposase